MMPNVDKIVYGITGTTISAIGVSISVTELQAIVSIIITVAGFLISVFIPLVIKLINKIRKAKEDGIITKEELEDIANTGKEIVQQTDTLIKETKDKSDKLKGENK